MPSFSQNEIVLIRYPFSDLTNFKVRPAIVVSGRHTSQDLIVVALTSKTHSLIAGEFILKDWKSAGLNVETAVKRGIFTIHEKLVLKSVGTIAGEDADAVRGSIRVWFALE